LYSLNILGRMAIAWVNIISRTVELLARIMTPQIPQPQMSEIIAERRDSNALHNEEDEISDAPPPMIQKPRTQSSFNSFRGRLGIRTGTDPGPSRPHNTAIPLRRSEPLQDTESPVEKLQTSPIQSSINIASSAINPKTLRRHHAKHADIDIKQELPHRMHTRAVIA